MKKLDQVTVLITGIGAPGAPGIIKSIRLNNERPVKIIGVDADVHKSSGIGLVDVTYPVPEAGDGEFVDTLLNLCKKEKVQVVIPLVTKELMVLSKNISLFNLVDIKVQVSDYDKLKLANNKYSLMQHCKEIKIPCPDFYLVNSMDDFRQKCESLGYPERRICFKPPLSNGLRGFRIISDGRNKMDNLINEKPNNVYIGFDEFSQIANDSDYFPELLVMEYLPGDEYSVDVLADNGKCHRVIPRLRDKIKMGISFVGTVVYDKQIINYSRKLVESLGLHGNIGLQFKRDLNGIPKIIESNPRVQGTIVLCTAAGYNMVYNSIKLAIGEVPFKGKIRWGTRMIRFWDELYTYKDTSFRLDI
jgi:carbamoyl-phosphate synthase large subunit